MTHLTPEERVLGRENADRALGMSRRDWLKAAAATPALGAFYFGYSDMKGKAPVRAAIIGTGDEGCQAMIRSHNREYLDFIGYCDIRPSQRERAVKEFSNHKDYSAADVKKLKSYATKEDMYADPDVEMIVIALPLWLHAPVAIEAMNGPCGTATTRSRWWPKTRMAARFTIPKRGWRSTFTTRKGSPSIATVGSEFTPRWIKTSTTRNTVITAWTS
jgi:hypothetical protein